MADRDDSNPTNWTVRRVSRRSILRYSVLSAAALSLAAACQQAATPAPTTAPAPAAKPTEAPKPAAPAATTAPAAAKPTDAPKPAAPAATTAPQTAPAALPKVSINGKFVVVQSRDFHPDHNAFIEAKIKEFGTTMGYPLEHSYIEAYAGSGDVVQKLTAAVQAGDAPDLVIHTLPTSTLHFLDIVEEVDALEQELEKDLGKTFKGTQLAARIENKWYSIPHFSRAGGYFVRQSAFKDLGIDPLTQPLDYGQLRDAALAMSKPDKEFWGWGMTVNRSGDGDTIVRNAIFQWGGQITEETGQLVVLNNEPFRTNAIAGLNWLKEVYQDPKYASMLPPGVLGWTDPSNNEAWLGGKVGVTTNAGTVYAKAVVDKNPVADDTFLILQPKGLGPNGKALMGDPATMNFYIMKGAKNRAASEQLIKFLSTQAIYKEMFKISTGYVYPAREWGWDQPEITESTYAKHVTGNWQKILNDPSGYLGSPYPGSPQPHIGALDTSNFLTDMFGEILGGKSVEDSLKSAHDRAVRTFKEFGAKGE